MKRKKNQSPVKKQNMEVLVLDSGYQLAPAAKKGKDFKAFWSFLALFLTVSILLGSVLSAFSIKLSWPPVVIGILLYSLLFTWLFLEKRLDGKRIFAVLFLIILYGVLCFVFQDQITSGFYQTADRVIRRINQAYGGNLGSFGAAGTSPLYFWLCVLFPVTGVLGGSLVKNQRWLPVLAVLFPVAALTMAAGGRPGTLWLYLFVLMVLLLFTAGRNHLPGWKTAGMAVFLAVVISVPSWYLARPLLSAPAAAFSRTALRLQNHFLQSLWQILPKISGGNLQLSLEGVGGGVEDGQLGAVDGYYFTGVNALKVTSDQMPQETVYLKGFIGETYTGSSFVSENEENFQNATASWKTEGQSSTYVQNLPFLRMLYYENYGGEQENASSGISGDVQTTANTITVENLNANSQYTYVPYNAFLNDNYQIEGGDASVAGQTVQDDIFSCYWRSDYQKVMESYRDGENTDGVLNSLEASYRSFCNTYDLQVPETGLEQLEEECKKTKEEEHWGESEMGVDRPDWDIAEEYEEIRQYVIRRLLSQCDYELDVDKLPEGQDFVETFLYDTREGYSMHFAAAATMMFRMFGVPARYVVGYVAQKELFTLDENGSYTAILEDDNAHAWVEIYEPFLGWVPVEVTPGMEAQVTEKEEQDQESGAPSPEKKENSAEDSQEESAGFKLFSWFTGNLESIMIAVQILLAVLVVAFLVRKIKKERKKRLGIGEKETGQILAIYRTLYEKLVKKGMPESCTMTDGSVTDYLQAHYTGMTAADLQRLQTLILTVSYGFQEISREDVLWLRRFGGKLKKKKDR